jgi:hypothetical protein
MGKIANQIRTYDFETYKVNGISFYCKVYDNGIISIQSSNAFSSNDSREGWHILIEREYTDNKNPKEEYYFKVVNAGGNTIRYFINHQIVMIPPKNFKLGINTHFSIIVRKDQYRTEVRDFSGNLIPNRENNIEQPPSSKFSLTEIIRWLFSSCLPWFNK